MMTALCCSSCSSDAPVGVSGGDPGTGTGTLKVLALIEAEQTVDNARDPSRFATSFKVEVTKEGTPLDGAVVSMEMMSGTLRLEAEGAGTYRGQQSGYSPSFSLEVKAGADSLTVARLDGLPAHSFSSPGELPHPANQPLTVTWAPAGAQAATIETNEMPATTVPDTGTFVVPASYLRARSGEDDKDRVRVVRTLGIALAGGAPGSSLKVSVRNEVSFVLR